MFAACQKEGDSSGVEWSGVGDQARPGHTDMRERKPYMWVHWKEASIWCFATNYRTKEQKVRTWCKFTAYSMITAFHFTGRNGEMISERFKARHPQHQPHSSACVVRRVSLENTPDSSRKIVSTDENTYQKTQVAHDLHDRAPNTANLNNRRQNPINSPHVRSTLAGA